MRRRGSPTRAGICRVCGPRPEPDSRAAPAGAIGTVSSSRSTGVASTGPAGGGAQQVGPHLAGALVAVERVLRQRLEHDRVDGRGDVRG